MAERFKAHAWKVCVLSKVPWVRIPLSPPKAQYIFVSNNRYKLDVKMDYILIEILNK